MSYNKDLMSSKSATFCYFVTLFNELLPCNFKVIVISANNSNELKLKFIKRGSSFCKFPHLLLRLNQLAKLPDKNSKTARFFVIISID